VRQKRHVVVARSEPISVTGAARRVRVRKLAGLGGRVGCCVLGVMSRCYPAHDARRFEDLSFRRVGSAAGQEARRMRALG
jgi:hypothetical protein